MKRPASIFAIVVVLICALFLWRRFLPGYLGMKTIRYQGEEIKLSKSYFEYEDYKDDPDNIDPSENAHVERLVSKAPIAHSFRDRKEFAEAIMGLKFPGYGLGTFAQKVQPDGTLLELTEVEIPRANQERYLTFEVRNGTYTLIDDFVAVEPPYITQVRKENGSFIYSTDKGVNVITRPVQ